MRTHTSQFKEEIKQYGRQFSDNIYYNNTTYNGDHIFSVNYSVDTTLCKSIMQSLRIDTDISLNVGDTLDYGISLENTTDEIRFNNFIVNKIEEQKDKKSNLVTCYDNMIKAMKDYESFYNATTDTTFTTNKNYYQLDNGKYKRYTGDRTGNPSSLGLYQSAFPMTIRNYLSAICSKLGLTFKNASDTFTNYNKQVTSEHYVDVDGNSLGYTFRDTLDDIAEVVGGFICIDNNGQLEIRNISNAIGKNIFNSTSVVQGYIDSSTSKVTYNSGYRVSTFKVEPNTTYTISKRKNSYNYIGTRQTSASGTLSNVTNMQDYTTSRVKATITTGANDNYLFIDLGPINNYYTIRDSIQVEIGNEVTDFETYGTDTINEEYFKDKNVNVGKKIGPYNVVVLSRVNEDNLYYPTTLPSNPIEFKITDNVILDQDNREDFIQGIYNKINGLEFYLNDFATNGILYYEIGDKYNVSLDSVTYPCLMLNDDIKRTTGLKENIRTDEPKQSVTEFKYASSSDKVEITSRNAKILVDKANASISQIVSAVGDNGQVTSASIIQSINDDTSSIKLEADKIDLNGAVTANNNFIINQDGSVEMNNGYITLTDNPSDIEDRFIIWASDKSRLMSATSEYVIVRTYDENNPNSTYYSYAQLYDDGRVTWGDTTDSNNGTSGNCSEDFITLIKKVNGTTTRSTYASDGATINGGLNYKGQFLTSGDANDYKSFTTCMAILNHNGSFLNVPTIEPNGDDVGFLNVYCWGGNADWTFQEYVVLKWNKTYKYIRRKVVQGWSAWERIYKQTILYDGGGTDNTITISENFSNYEYIEIFFFDDAGRGAGSVKVQTFDNRPILLSLTETESGFIVIKSGQWHTSGTSLVKDNGAFTQIFHNGSIVGNNNSNWLLIYKVVGYN